MFLLAAHWTSKGEYRKGILGTKAWLKWVSEGMRVLEGLGPRSSAQCGPLAPGLLLAWVVWAQVLTIMSAGFVLVAGTLRFPHLYREPGYIVLLYLACLRICS